MIFHKKILWATSLLALLTIIITGVYTSSAEEGLVTPVPNITTGTKCGGTMIVRKNFPPDLNATNFEIYRAAGQVNSGNEFQQIATVPAVDGSFVYTDTGLTPSYMYRYKLLATNSTTTSALSDSVSAISSAECAVITPPIVYPVPTTPTLGVSKVSGSCNINLSWNGVSGVQTYNLYRQKSGGTLSKLTSLTSSNTTYSDTSITSADAGTIQYSIVASNSTGSSATSTASVTQESTCSTTIAPPTQLPPSVPTGFSALQSGNCGYLVNLSWNKVANATGYKIFRSENSNGTGYVQVSGSPLTTSSQTPTFKDDLSNLSGVATTKSYFYRIYSTNSAGDSISYASANSRPSSICSPTSLLTPVAPTVSTASKCGGKITVTWPRVTSNGSTALLNNLYRSTSANGTFTKVGNGYAGYNDTGSPSTIYYYKTTTIDGTAESAESPVSSGKSSVSCTNTPAGPVAPSNLKVTTSPMCGGKVSLSWTASPTSGVTYKIRRSKSSGSNFTVLTSSATTTSYTDTAPDTDTKYYYIVSAINSNGQESVSTPSASAESSATCQEAPPAPQNLRAYPSDICGGKIRLVWTGEDTPGNTLHYNIYRGTTNDNLVKIAENYLGKDFTDNTGSSGANYSYKVSAVDAGVESDRSNIARSISSPMCKPILPAPTVAYNISSIHSLCAVEVRLNWNRISESIGYNVYKSINSGDYKLLYTTNSTTTTFSDFSLETGESASYKVSAINTDREGALSNPLVVIVPDGQTCENIPFDPGIVDPSITPENIRRTFGDDNANGICEQGEGCNSEWSGIGDDNGNGVCDPGEMCYPDETGTSTIVYDESVDEDGHPLSVEELIGPSSAVVVPNAYILSGDFISPSNEGRYFPIATALTNDEDDKEAVHESCVWNIFPGGPEGSAEIYKGTTFTWPVIEDLAEKRLLGPTLMANPYQQFPTSTPRKLDPECESSFWGKLLYAYSGTSLGLDKVYNGAFGMFNPTTDKVEYDPLSELEVLSRNFNSDIQSPDFQQSKVVLTRTQADLLQYQSRTLLANLVLEAEVKFKHNVGKSQPSRDGESQLSVHTGPIILREALNTGTSLAGLPDEYRKRGVFISDPISGWTLRGKDTTYPIAEYVFGTDCSGRSSYDKPLDPFTLVVDTRASNVDGSGSEPKVRIFGPLYPNSWALKSRGDICAYSDRSPDYTDNVWIPSATWYFAPSPIAVNAGEPGLDYASNNPPITGTNSSILGVPFTPKLYYHTDATRLADIAYVDGVQNDVSITSRTTKFSIKIVRNNDCYPWFGRYSANCELLEPMFPIVNDQTTHNNLASQMLGAISEAFWNIVEAIKSIFKRD